MSEANLPDINDNNKLPDIPDETVLNYSLELAQYTLYKRYLPDLSHYPVAEPDKAFLSLEGKDCVSLFKLEKLVCKQDEDILQKLSTVYYASMSIGSSLIVMVDVKEANKPADIYIGVRNTDNNMLVNSGDMLRNEMKSNFPGTVLTQKKALTDYPEIEKSIFSDDSFKSISSVTCVGALRDKSMTESKSFIQGIERFIDAMHGNPYTAIFIAEPVTNSELSGIRDGYEELYSSLSSFSKSSLSYSLSENKTITTGMSRSITHSINKSISHTQSHTNTKGGNVGINIGGSFTHTEGGPTKIARVSQMVSALGGALTGGASLASIGAASCPPLAIGLAIAGGVASVLGGGAQGGNSGNSIGGMFGLNAGLQKSIADTVGDTEGETTGEAKQKQEHKDKAIGESKSKTVQIERVNKHIEAMLERIDDQLKRIRECEDYGSYNCGAYFIASDEYVSQLAANSYRALMIGDGASVESSAVNTWTDETTVKLMKEYLMRFAHPVFGMPYAELKEDKLEFVKLSAGTIVSGLELPLHLGLPTRSVNGLPVVQHAEFGRNISSSSPDSADKAVKIGNIYHMGNREETEVKLDKEMLTSHTFITGSTGAGKSNAVYELLSRLCNNEEEKIKFLVIEPAKGEYRKKLSGENVRVYGLLPGKSDSELLKINPFSFPEEIHLLEHLDRITELFNVCWPMYAAMPAILKEAVQKAYEHSGWDIITSENRFGYRLFPDFSDIEREVRRILDESDYSADNKSDYVGSLVTRIHSLTHGLFGMVFQGNELSYDELFERNVIVDLSRSGSVETKSLIMGILVLKLQEYRMSGAEGTDEGLRHMTVLEEAHHLLRKCPVGAGNDGGDLRGKAVEMLTNAIAEMRTYGEGFVIADQSPGLLDLSVIRNTNTKIILRLPDRTDCELVGKAVGLNDSQIDEISRLERGVAVVKQNSWLEAVLCSIDRFIPPETVSSRAENRTHDDSEAEKLLFGFLAKKVSFDEIVKNKTMLLDSGLKTSIKCRLLSLIGEGGGSDAPSYAELVYDFFEAEKALKSVMSPGRPETNTMSICFNILMALKYPLRGCSHEVKISILILIFKVYLKRGGKETSFIQNYIELKDVLK